MWQVVAVRLRAKRRGADTSKKSVFPTKHELQKIAGAMDDIVLKPARATGTRWLDHSKRAMAVLEKDYGSLVSQFEDLGSGKRKDGSAGDAAKMLGYIRKIKCAKFTLYLAS